MFSKDFFLRVVENRDCAVKSYLKTVKLYCVVKSEAMQRTHHIPNVKPVDPLDVAAGPEEPKLNPPVVPEIIKT